MFLLRSLLSGASWIDFFDMPKISEFAANKALEKIQSSFEIGIMPIGYLAVG